MRIGDVTVAILLLTGIYQPLNKCFTIESTINKMREDELNAAIAKDNEPLPEDPTEKAEESTEASSDDSSSDVQ